MPSTSASIVWLAGLYDADQISSHDVGPSRLSGHFTARPDLAHTLLTEAISANHPPAVIDVVSQGQPPSPFNFLREVAKLAT